MDDHQIEELSPTGGASATNLIGADVRKSHPYDPELATATATAMASSLAAQEMANASAPSVGK